jgi:P pilus assembly chaperone PapD
MDIRHRHVHPDRRVHPLDTLIVAARAAAVLIALHASATAVSAQAQVSVEVSPLRVELKLAAGATQTQAVTLTNTGKEAVRIRVSVLDWHLAKDGAPQFEEPADGRPYSASRWIRVAPPELVIQPGMEGTVRFTMAVPQGIEPAGYRTGIMFDLSPASGDPIARRREVAVRSRIATLVYANVGEPRAAVDLIDLRSRVTPEQTIVLATLKNTSRRTVRTKGTLTVFGAASAVVREVAVPDVPVLPESERDVAIVLAENAVKPLPPGEYRIEVKIDVGLPALLIGETTLKIGK